MDFSKWRPEILHEIEYLVFYNYFVFFWKKNKFSGSIIFRYLCIVVYFDRQLLSKWITKKTWKMLVMHCWCLCGKLNLFFLFQC